MVYATVWIDPNELGKKLAMADFADALIANDKVRLFEFVQLLFLVEGFHVGQLAADFGVLFHRQQVIEHAGKVGHQIVVWSLNVPVLRNQGQHNMRVKLHTPGVSLHKVKSLFLVHGCDFLLLNTLGDFLLGHQ